MMPRILPLFLALALLPTAASALTVQEVVALSKAGVSENVLLAMIDRDNTIFAIDANQLIALKRDGVSEKIVIAMLRSGREEPQLSQPVSTDVVRLAETSPTLVGVGHGPDRPNTYHSFDALGAFIYPAPLLPLVYPTPYPVTPWLRTVPTCSAGRRIGSGSRTSTDSSGCRRTR